MAIYKNDIDILKTCLINLPKFWDGKTCVLELKEADYNWRQMEWWAFYFEYKVKQLLTDKFSFPGDKYDNVSFDLKGTINWDLKAKAIKSDDHKVILNDKSAMEQSIEKLGYHGEIIALCDVEYNDIDWHFREWQAELKGKWDFDFEKNRNFSLYKYCITNIIICNITSKFLSIFLKKTKLNSNFSHYFLNYKIIFYKKIIFFCENDVCFVKKTYIRTFLVLHN